jgi:hypothetical protein
MVKKIKTETALGIIFIIAIAVAGSIYFLSQENFIIASKIFKKKNTAPAKSQSDNLRLLFASSGKRSIYKVQKGDKWAVEIDGEESEAYDYVDNATFSADGLQFAYSATNNGQAFVIFEKTVQQQVYDKILQIIFSPDGKTLGYIAERGDQSVIVMNGHDSKTYQEISPFQTSSGSTYIIFSPDGQNVAYKVVDTQGVYMVINGQAGQTYTDITSFVFSQDGTFTYQAQSGDQPVTVVNNQEVVPVTGGTSGIGSTTGSSGQAPSSSSSKYSAKKSKDVHLDQSRLFYPACTGDSTSKNCNF